MKSLVEFIAEAQVNTTIKRLFDDIDKKLSKQEWDEVAPLIESIFKNKWGKTIKADDNFRDTIKRGEQLLLGYNIKTKSWRIAFYNARANSVYGCSYNGERNIIAETKGPCFWSNVEDWLKKETKMKLRYADSNADECRTIINEISMAHYNYENNYDD